MNDELSRPAAVDRDAFEAELDRLRVREKAHTREGDAIAAARRRLPMVEVDANLELIRPNGPLTLLDAFEGRRQLIAYYSCGSPADPHRSSAKAARGSPPRSPNCPTRIRATSPTRSCVRAPTTKAAATATSWAGTCPGARLKTRRPAGRNSGESAVTLSSSAPTGVQSPSGRDSTRDILTISLLDRSLE
jgi:Bacterial protein of unknown function (DUF899)